MGARSSIRFPGFSQKILRDSFFEFSPDCPNPERRVVLTTPECETVAFVPALPDRTPPRSVKCIAALPLCKGVGPICLLWCTGWCYFRGRAPAAKGLPFSMDIKGECRLASLYGPAKLPPPKSVPITPPKCFFTQVALQTLLCVQSREGGGGRQVACLLVGIDLTVVRSAPFSRWRFLLLFSKRNLAVAEIHPGACLLFVHLTPSHAAEENGLGGWKTHMFHPP